MATAETGSARGDDFSLLRVDDDEALPFRSTAIDGEGTESGASAPGDGIVVAGTTATSVDGDSR